MHVSNSQSDPAPTCVSGSGQAQRSAVETCLEQAEKRGGHSAIPSFGKVRCGGTTQQLEHGEGAISSSGQEPRSAVTKRLEQAESAGGLPIPRLGQAQFEGVTQRLEHCEGTGEGDAIPGLARAQSGVVAKHLEQSETCGEGAIAWQLQQAENAGGCDTNPGMGQAQRGAITKRLEVAESATDNEDIQSKGQVPKIQSRRRTGTGAKNRGQPCADITVAEQRAPSVAQALETKLMRLQLPPALERLMRVFDALNNLSAWLQQRRVVVRDP